MTKYTIHKEKDGLYEQWFKSQTAKSQSQILDRFSKIEIDGYFGHVKDLDQDGDCLQELKFNDGRRIYFIIIPIRNVMILLGGNKNGQDKDIKKARAIIAKAKSRLKT